MSFDRRFHAVLVEPALGMRRLDPRESRPYSLAPVGDSDAPVLDWILTSLEKLQAERITYVGGYHIEKILDSYPDLRVTYQHDRIAQGEIATMLLAPAADRDTVILRADVVFLPQALGLLLESEESCFGMIGGTHGDAPCVAIRVREDAAAAFFERAKTLSADNPAASFGDLVTDIAGDDFVHVDLSAHAAPIADRPAISQVIFKGKVQTLDNLAGITKQATVLPRFRFTSVAWSEDRAAILADIRRTFPKAPVIVRSSASDEDGQQTSAAGAFDSILDIDPGNEAALSGAIDKVIDSYAKNGRQSSPDDEVLVQPQIRDLVYSGVLLSRDPGSGAPYFVINADGESGRSDVVTSGTAGKIQTFYIRPQAAVEHLPKETRQVFEAGRELVRVTGNESLDMEFGIDQAGTLFLFQARPLSGRPSLPVAEQDFDDMLSAARAFVEAACGRKPGVAGKRSVLGVMPDWNPAEMIGDAPKPLALSLYQSLIGESCWAEARAMIGYKDMRPHQLILSVAGRPYVDVRNTFNSFLPAGLDSDTAEAWVDSCIDRLAEHPELHDKIEFDIAVTCLTPDWENDRRRLAEAGLNDIQIDDFRDRLRHLTQAVLSGEAMSVAALDRQLASLEARRRELLALSDDSLSARAYRLHALFDDCRRFGIVPFSILARYGFIALAMLRSLRAQGVLSGEEVERFHRAVPTVAGRFSEDVDRLLAGDLTLDDMLERYGHLRPHSYDITAASYADDPQKYFSPKRQGKAESGPAPDDEPDCRSVLAGKKQAIEQAMSKVGLTIGFDAFIDFLVSAIAGREAAKFQFMKNLDAILREIIAIGRHLGISRDRLAFVPVEEFLVLAGSSPEPSVSAHLRRLIDFKEKRWQLTKCLHLPELIRTADEVDAFEVIHDRPNFVTRASVTAPAAWLDEDSGPIDLNGRIAVIGSADPGYDWIFGYDLAGLVTKYGGAGSHMSIRAAEFGLPAAIGCGEGLYESLRGGDEIEIDCAQGIVRIP